MSKKEKLTFKVIVTAETEYSIKIRIGDGQDGDHNVFGTCPFETNPDNDNPEWNSKLGKGAEIKNKILYVSSVTQDTNPHTNFVSVRVFINDDQITPLTGSNELAVDESDIVYFNQQIDFV